MSQATPSFTAVAAFFARARWVLAIVVVATACSGSGSGSDSEGNRVAADADGGPSGDAGAAGDGATAGDDRGPLPGDSDGGGDGGDVSQTSACLGTVGDFTRPETTVTTDAELQTALDHATPGDSILLADGSYAALTVHTRVFAGFVRVHGSRNAHVRSASVDASQGLTFEGFTVTPETSSTRAVFSVTKSKRVRMSNVLVDGVDDQVGAGLDFLKGDDCVVLIDSELTKCGVTEACLNPEYMSELDVTHNEFHDCLGCDFIRGIASTAHISDNHLHDAVGGGSDGGGAKTDHSDGIQVFGGGPWLIEHNWFQHTEKGAAQIYLDPPGYNTTDGIHDVTIQSNVMIDGRPFNIQIDRGTSTLGYPKLVKVINNTMLSGNFGAINLADADGPTPRPAELTPLIANNVLWTAPTSGVCALEQTSISWNGVARVTDAVDRVA